MDQKEYFIEYIEFVFPISGSLINKIKNNKINPLSHILYTASIFSYSLAICFLNGFNSFSGIIVTFFISYITGILLIISACAWVHFISGLTDKYGNLKDIANLFFLSFNPMILLLPALVIFHSVSLIFNSVVERYYFSIFLVLSSLFIFINLFKSIKYNYNFTSLQTLFIFITPIIIIELIFIAGFAFFILLILF